MKTQLSLLLMLFFVTTSLSSEIIHHREVSNPGLPNPMPPGFNIYSESISVNQGEYSIIPVYYIELIEFESLYLEFWNICNEVKLVDASLENGTLDIPGISIEVNTEYPWKFSIYIHCDQAITICEQGIMFFLETYACETGSHIFSPQNWEIGAYYEWYSFELGQITINQSPSETLNLTTGWNTVSLGLDPFNENPAQFLYPISSEAIIIQNPMGYYYPLSDVNTLGEISIQSGYYINVNSAVDFTYHGEITGENIVDLDSGWSLLPALCPDSITIENAFGESLKHLEMIRDAEGLDIYWPEKNIKILEKLCPRKCYQVKMDSSCQIIF